MENHETLQFDETALCLFHRLQMLYEDAHAWFKTDHTDAPQNTTKFLRLQDIAHERDQVSMDLCEHIAYVLLADTDYRTGTPGISLEAALFIKLNVRQMNLQRSAAEARNHLHEALRTLMVIA